MENGFSFETYYQNLVDDNKAGLAIAIYRAGQWIYEAGHGQDGYGKKIDGDTRFYLASVTKMFTSIATQVALDEFGYDLDTPLAIFFPDIYRADKITLRDMLAMRSSIPDTCLLSIMGAVPYPWDVSDDLEDKLYGLKWDTKEPGAIFYYSNMNYYLLAHIIEKLSGQTFNDYLQDKICRPLGLKNTGFIEEGMFAKDNHVAVPFIAENDKERALDRLPVAKGLGNGYSSLNDLKRLFEALRQHTLRPDILSGWFKREASHMKPGYGLGLHHLQSYDFDMIGHNGSWYGVKTAFFYDADKDFGMIGLSNNQDLTMQKFFHPVLKEISEVTYPDLKPLQAFEDVKEFIHFNSGLYIRANRQEGGVRADICGQEIDFYEAEAGHYFAPCINFGMQITWSKSKPDVLTFTYGGDDWFFQAQDFDKGKSEFAIPAGRYESDNGALALTLEKNGSDYRVMVASPKTGHKAEQNLMPTSANTAHFFINIDGFEDMTASISNHQMDDNQTIRYSAARARGLVLTRQTD